MYIYVHIYVLYLPTVRDFFCYSSLAPLFMGHTFTLHFESKTLGTNHLPTENETLGQFNTKLAPLGIRCGKGCEVVREGSIDSAWVCDAPTSQRVSSSSPKLPFLS
jgi:hypothetical protein